MAVCIPALCTTADAAEARAARLREAATNLLAAMADPMWPDMLCRGQEQWFCSLGACGQEIAALRAVLAATDPKERPADGEATPGPTPSFLAQAHVVSVERGKPLPPDGEAGR